jgi:hypothetical protein
MFVSIISTFIVFMPTPTWRSLAFSCKLHHNYEERNVIQDTHTHTHTVRRAHSLQSVEWPLYVQNGWDFAIQSTASRLNLGPIQAYVHWYLGLSFFMENGNLHLQSTKVKNVWVCTSSVFLAWYLISDRDKIPCLHYMERQLVSWFISPNVIGMITY